jgi:hypothetical protein
VLQYKGSAMGIWKTIKAAFGRGTSTPPDQYTLRETDEQVKAGLAAFAAQSEHRSTFTAEGRVYFTRKAP